MIIKIVSIILILVLFLLDWAALHDIIKGEPDITMEYVVIAASLLVVPMLLNYVLRENLSRSE